MNVARGCVWVDGSMPGVEAMVVRPSAGAIGLAKALVAGATLLVGLHATAAPPVPYPQLSLKGDIQIPNPAPFSLDTGIGSYVLKTAILGNDGTNVINNVAVKLTALVDGNAQNPVESSCVAACDGVIAKAVLGEYFIPVLNPKTFPKFIVTFRTATTNNMQVVGTVRVNNDTGTSDRLVTTLKENATIQLGDGPNIALDRGYLPKDGGQLSSRKNALTTSVVLPPNSVASLYTDRVGSVETTLDSNSCSNMYNGYCFNIAIHLPEKGTPATPAQFQSPLTITILRDSSTLSNGAKADMVAFDYQPQTWLACSTTQGPPCDIFVSGDVQHVQACPEVSPTPDGYAAGRCFEGCIETSVNQKGGPPKKIWTCSFKANDNGLLLFR
jgi:hypothetical protein